MILRVRGRMIAEVDDVDLVAAFDSQAAHFESHADRLPFLYRGRVPDKVLRAVWRATEKVPPAHCIFCLAERLTLELEAAIPFDLVLAACMFRLNFMLPCVRLTPAHVKKALHRIQSRPEGLRSAMRLTAVTAFNIGLRQSICGALNFGAQNIVLYHVMAEEQSLFCAFEGSEATETDLRPKAPKLDRLERTNLLTHYAISHRLVSAPQTMPAPTGANFFFVGPELEAHLKAMSDPPIEARWALLPFSILPVPVNPDGSYGTATASPVWLEMKNNEPELVTFADFPVDPRQLITWIEQQRLEGEVPGAWTLPKLVEAQRSETADALIVLRSP